MVCYDSISDMLYMRGFQPFDFQMLKHLPAKQKYRKFKPTESRLAFLCCLSP